MPLGDERIDKSRGRRVEILVRCERDYSSEDAGFGAERLLNAPPSNECDDNWTGDVCDLSFIHLLPTFSLDLLRPDSKASGPTDSDNELTN